MTLNLLWETNGLSQINQSFMRFLHFGVGQKGTRYLGATPFFPRLAHKESRVPTLLSASMILGHQPKRYLLEVCGLAQGEPKIGVLHFILSGRPDMENRISEYDFPCADVVAKGGCSQK